MKTLIEIHALQNFAPSNLNRDDTGAPKDAIFGGVRRARVSSQCSKRSVREYFKVQNKDWHASRTKRIVDELVERLVPKLSEGKSDSIEDIKKAVITAISCLGTEKKQVKVVKENKTDVLLFLSPQEISALADTIESSYSKLLNSKPNEAVIKAINNSVDGENKARLSIDVALFGRMLAVMPEKNQYAACQVAHAISTHGVDREFDYFTAVDDLKPEDTAASDMIGTVEFNSACYYRYAVIDWEKLVGNLQGDVELATMGLRAFLKGFVVAEPTGKQNTFAAHNPPEFVMTSVRHNAAPRNLVNAFEVPVRPAKGNSLTKISAESLTKKARALQAAYGGEVNNVILNADTNEIGEKVDSLQLLLDKTVALVRK